MNPSHSTTPTQYSHRPSRLHTTLGLLFIGCGLLIFGLLYIVLVQHNGMPTAADQSVLNWMIEHRDSRRTSLAVAFTNMLAPAVMLALTIIIAGAWYFTRKEIWRPALLIGSVGAGFLAVIAVKDITARIRPPLESMIAPLDVSLSFPSAHTAGVALCVLISGYLLYSRRQSRRNLLLWIDTAIFSITIVAVTRLYLGYHWLTDVSASIGIALTILGLVVIIDGYLLRKK